VGNNVRFSGINVGIVDNIEIVNDTTVRVTVLIDKDVQRFIRTDCMMAIGSEGLIGDKLITITQGNSTSPQVSEGQHLISVEPVETDAIIASLKVTAENAEFLSGQLAEILYNINNGNGTLARLIADSTIARNIDQTIVNLKQSAKGLDENMQAAKHNFLFRKYFRNKEKEKQENNSKAPENKKQPVTKKKSKAPVNKKAPTEVKDTTEKDSASVKHNRIKNLFHRKDD
jgi:phospholipid/cholesterol/gamma-HCH transport system substrate-binding protein